MTAPLVETPKMITEREAVLRERAAVKATVAVLWDEIKIGLGGRTSWVGEDGLAARLYPLPKIRRPRIVKFNPESRVELSVIDGHLMERCGSVSQWKLADSWILNDRFVAFLTDLFANPTEDSDDDGPPSLAQGNNQ